MLQPVEIFAAIDAQPSLMREDACEAYVGKEIDWSLAFINAKKSGRGQALAVFHFKPRGLRLIMGKARLSAHPELEFMRDGEIARVRGTIRRIDALCIELDIRDMVFTATSNIRVSNGR